MKSAHCLHFIPSLYKKRGGVLGYNAILIFWGELKRELILAHQVILSQFH